MEEEINSQDTYFHQLRRVGKINGLQGKLLKDYTRFMTSRFPKETDPVYMKEWAVRFYNNNEWSSSDGQSRQILLSINKIKYEAMLKGSSAPKKIVTEETKDKSFNTHDISIAPVNPGKKKVGLWGYVIGR